MAEPGEAVYSVYYPDGRPEEPQVFARRVDAQDYADLFVDAQVEEHRLLDSEWVEETAGEIWAEMHRDDPEGAGGEDG